MISYFGKALDWSENVLLLIPLCSKLCSDVQNGG